MPNSKDTAQYRRGTITDLLLNSGIPKFRGPVPPELWDQSVSLKWYGCQDEKYYLERLHSADGPDDIEYNLNSFGYRCPEFDAGGEIKVACFGCSFVFGLHVAQKDLFHERVCSWLAQRSGRQVVDYNLGICGSSNEAILRMISLAVPILKPDLVLINFTSPERRELFLPGGNAMMYVATSLATISNWTHQGAEYELIESAYETASPYEDAATLCRAYRSIAALLKDTPWLFSHYEDALYGELLPHFEEERYAGAFSIIDGARGDRFHPGPKSNEQLAGHYIERLERNTAALKKWS